MQSKPTLYFLRSSEQHIVNSMLTYAFCLDEQNKSANEFAKLDIYKTFYGLTRKDVGVYATLDNEVAGALWIRNLQDEPFATLNIAVKPKFRKQGLAKAMLEQIFLEAGNFFEKIAVKIHDDKKLIKFYESFGFTLDDSFTQNSLITNKPLIIMTKTLDKNGIRDMYDDYSTCKWMEP